MKKKIYYVSFYDTALNSAQNRQVIPSIASKMEAVLRLLTDAGVNVEILSMAPSQGCQHAPAVSYSINDHVSIRLFHSFGKRNLFMKLLTYGYLRMQLIHWMKKHLTSDDTVIVYHSLAYMNQIRHLKAKMNFKMILEMEELYSDVINRKHTKEKELALAALADGFIFPTELMGKKINASYKPSVILYGNYHIEEKRTVSFGDDRIHVVYAGTFDPRKGCMNAIDTGLLLPENYCMHLIGFGTDKEVEAVKSRVKDAQRGSHAEIRYDGLFRGEEYIEFLQKCQIGIVMQDETSAYVNSSFPLKLLSYLQNGLSVVAGYSPSVAGSKVADLVTFYQHSTAEEIADAIKKVDVHKKDRIEKELTDLDHQAHQDVIKLLKSV